MRKYRQSQHLRNCLEKIIHNFKFVLTIHLLNLLLFCLKNVGFDPLFFRQILLFIYLACVPGGVILTIIDVGNINLTKFILLSITISLSFLSLTLSLANCFFASIGVKVFGAESLLEIIVYIIVSLLIFEAWHKNPSTDRDFYSILYKVRHYIRPFTLLFIFFLLLLPNLSILGACNLSINGDNFLLIILLITVSIIPLFVALNNKLPREIYPLIIFLVSISLIFHTALSSAISIFEAGLPTFLVKIAGVWDPSFKDAHNSLLSSSVLIPALSTLLAVDIVVATKMISWLFFSLIPLIAYEIYRGFFDERLSFLSACSFIFYFFFYVELPYSIRTGYALLFLSSLILVAFEKNINPVPKRLLIILLSFLIIASHYGTAYIFIFCLFFILIISFLFRRLSYLKNDVILSSPIFFTLYFTLSLAYYIYTSGSINLEILPRFLKNVLVNISEFLHPQSSATMLWIYVKGPSFSIEVTKYLIYLLIFFMLIGFLYFLLLIFKKEIGAKKEGKLSEYIIFPLSFFLVFLAIFLPRIEGTLRFFTLLLIMAAPLSIIGLSTILNVLIFVINRAKIKSEFEISHKTVLVVFSIFLILFLYFSSGVISNTITEAYDYSPNFLIDKKKIQASDDYVAKKFLYWDNPEIHNLYSTEWLIKYHYQGKEVYRDFEDSLFARYGKINVIGETCHVDYGGVTILSWELKLRSIIDLFSGEQKRKEAYVFLARHNYVEKTFIRGEEHHLTSEHLNILEGNQRIYDNGGSVIYFTN